MGRPIKNNADYFSHDADMRNDPKVKALRRKFGVDGYAIWCMTLEYLTDCEYFTFELTDINIELVAGDFDVDPLKIREVLEYCFIIDLLQLDGKSVKSKNHNKRMEPILQKREKTKKTAEDRERSRSGEFLPQQLQSPGEPAPVLPQSKVKESKVKESINTMCSVFGKDYKEPLDRMPAEVGFYRDIEIQYGILEQCFKEPEMITQQIKAYLKHCNTTKRKKIGTAYKLAETIISSDWIKLNQGTPTGGISISDQPRKVYAG
jgi:hypothetical protein